MILICDSRQQAGKHKNIDAYCKRMGIEQVTQCLENGDYMEGERDENGNVHPVGKISVDTKFSIMELSKDIMSRDHERFRNCCIRAKEQGIQLVILIEEEPPKGKIALWEVPKWETSDRFHRKGDPMTLVNPEALRKAMLTMWQKYGVIFEFCTRKKSPARVIQILKGELR